MHEIVYCFFRLHNNERNKYIEKYLCCTSGENHERWTLFGFLATGSPLKMMKNNFYFIFKALFVLNVLKFLRWLFDHVEKRLD